MNSQLLFFFMALGAFNSSILSLYFLIFRKKERLASLFLGGLLAVLSIRIWKSIFFYFNPELSKIYLQIGLSACFLIGPLLVNYILAIGQGGQRHKKALWWHLAVNAGVILVIGLIYPYQQFPDFWGDRLYKVINYQWLAYLILGAWLCRDRWKKLFRAPKSMTEEDVWVLSVYSGVALIWLAYYFSSFTSYIMGALCFSFGLYLSILLIYLSRRKKAQNKKPKYEGQRIPEDQANALLDQIEQLMLSQQLFKDPKLNLSGLSKELRIRPHMLSQLLNDNKGQNFSQFVNGYRIAEAKRLLDAQSPLKLEAIAEECGFNSSSTFYTAFKKATGTTPAQYAQNQ